MQADVETRTDLPEQEINASRIEIEQARTSLKLLASPVQLAIMTATVFLAEAIIVFLSANLPALPVHENALVHSCLFLTIVFPIFYFVTFRPLRLYLKEFKRVEKALRQKENAERALLESEEKYRSLVESTNDSIYLVDKNHRYLHMNKKHATRMGFSADEYAGRSYGEFHTPEDTAAFVEDVDKVFETGESMCRERRSSRDNRYFLLTLSPVKSGDRKVAAVTIISKDITELKEMEEKLRTLSLTDELTGLYNRRGFFTMIDHILKLSKRQQKGVYMLFADLDKLKVINDTWGHQEGDLALIDTANILNATYRESDIIARISGDEFVVIPIGTTGDNIENVAARLRRNIENHNATTKRNYKLSISFGISHFDPQNPCSPDELLAQGDKLMYEQKKVNRES
jgi:diguanylate cyclase (GGDEF)-like protein/PAS domain S-box-containing protein